MPAVLEAGAGGNAGATGICFHFFLASCPPTASGSSPHNEEATLTTQEFALQSRARTLRVRHSTDVDNNWVDITTTLVEKITGEAYQGAQEVGYYRGGRTLDEHPT